MERELPVKDLYGTLFYVDIVKDELRQVDRPFNTIPFFEMRYSGTYYEFLYDPDTQNIADVLLGKSTERMQRIRLEQLVELDPVGMAAKYGLKAQDITDKSDFDIMVNQDLLTKRKQGQLPVIDVAGHPFYIEVHWGMLRPKDDFATRVMLDDLETNAEGTEYYFFYRPKDRQVIELDPKMTELPQGVVMVILPEDKKLDPVAFARKYDIDPVNFLRNNPIEKDLKAKIVRLKDTSLVVYVRRNLDALQSKDTEPKSKSKKR